MGDPNSHLTRRAAHLICGAPTGELGAPINFRLGSALASAWRRPRRQLGKWRYIDESAERRRRAHQVARPLEPKQSSSLAQCSYFARPPARPALGAALILTRRPESVEAEFWCDAAALTERGRPAATGLWGGHKLVAPTPPPPPPERQRGGRRTCPLVRLILQTFKSRQVICLPAGLAGPLRARPNGDADGVTRKQWPALN